MDKSTIEQWILPFMPIRSLNDMVHFFFFAGRTGFWFGITMSSSCGISIMPSGKRGFKVTGPVIEVVKCTFTPPQNGLSMAEKDSRGYFNLSSISNRTGFWEAYPNDS